MDGEQTNLKNQKDEILEIEDFEDRSEDLTAGIEIVNFAQKEE